MNEIEKKPDKIQIYAKKQFDRHKRRWVKKRNRILRKIEKLKEKLKGNL